MVKTNGQIDTERVGVLVANYIDTRDHIKKLKKKHEQELAEFELLLNKLAGRMLQFLDLHDQEMARTAAGTVSATVRDTASLQDPDVFMEFVTERGLFDLLDRRANVTACKVFRKEHGTLPPGVRINSIRGVSVRTATSSERTES